MYSAPDEGRYSGASISPPTPLFQNALSTVFHHITYKNIMAFHPLLNPDEQSEEGAIKRTIKGPDFSVPGLIVVLFMLVNEH